MQAGSTVFLCIHAKLKEGMYSVFVDFELFFAEALLQTEWMTGWRRNLSNDYIYRNLASLWTVRGICQSVGFDYLCGHICLNFPSFSPLQL